MTKKTLPKMFLILLFFTTPLLPMWSFADDTGDARYYYAFNGDAGEQIANLAQPDESKDRLVYHPNGETLQWVDGIVPGLKAARLDRAYFEAPALTPSGKAFSFTIWFRKNGPGLLTGNNGSKTGTIIGMGDGYWSGMRVTTSDSSKRVAFHIGRPQPSSAVTLESQDDVYDGVWNHLAVTWDGRQMRIYLNGIISGVRDYDGAFTPPNWGLRVGFNDAGIGSINMDVQQLASYDRALTPFEVFTQATSVDDGNEKPLPTPPITNPPLSTPEQREAMVLFLSERIASGKKWTDKDEDQFFEQFGRLSRHTNFLSKMQRETIWLMFAKLRPTRELPHEIFLTYVSSEDTSKLIRDRLLRSLVPNATGTPMIRVPLEVYEKLLAEVSMSPEEKRQLETIIDQLKAFQAGGRPLSERSRSRSESGYPPTELKSLALLDDKLATTIRATDRESVKFDWSQYVGESGKSFDTLHVAPHGKADNTGSLESPFGSLEQARNKIRQLHRAFGRGIEVLVHGGKYDIRETITFDEIHSGTADSPVVYRNAPGETPVFSGGLNISGAFEKVSDATILARVPESVRGELMVADLKTLGVTGSLFPIPERGYGRNGPDAAPWFEVYVDGKPQQIARYPNYDADAPNDCFILTGEVSQGKSDTPSQRQPGVFKYADDRASRWAADEDVWLFGYWRHLWAATSHPVASIDSAARTITMARPDGYGYYENMPFYAFNIFSEIDVPGEWWLDRKTNRLYILPPLDDDGQPVDLNSVSVMIPQFDGPFIECRNVSHVTFHGLNMGDCAGTAFKSYGGERLLLAGCTFERLGNWAIAMHDGKHNGVYGCDMTWLGGGGVTISGGNLRTLEPGNCFVENCRVSHFTLVDRVYAPAVSLDGVRN
ncbi:MAG: LamG domain-containing protein, partial [Planctomycetaceae bacterium]|nr:LamG domain-containing protein [Planctomycetaceae bacterium]